MLYNLTKDTAHVLKCGNGVQVSNDSGSKDDGSHTHTDTVRLVRHFGYCMCTKVPDERVSINENYQLKNKRVEETNAIW